MKRLSIIVFALCFFAMSSLFAKELMINKEMTSALKRFNNKFVHWKTNDYSRKVHMNALERKAVPWALALNVNGDKRNDIVLDGHDDKQSMLICLISEPAGYRVEVIKETPLENPRTIKSWNDGKKEKGLNYFLWPNSQSSTSFTKAYPQQTDTSGKLLNDGVMYDYIFENAKFQEKYQVL